jgi:hypothetical protein
MLLPALPLAFITGDCDRIYLPGAGVDSFLAEDWNGRSLQMLSALHLARASLGLTSASVRPLPSSSASSVPVRGKANSVLLEWNSRGARVAGIIAGGLH